VRWSDFHRLRKYRRKLAAALKRPGREATERLFALKWRYWHKLHGPHVLLWALE
jgi:hypothetical protein